MSNYPWFFWSPPVHECAVCAWLFPSSPQKGSGYEASLLGGNQCTVARVKVIREEEEILSLL